MKPNPLYFALLTAVSLLVASLSHAECRCNCNGMEANGRLLQKRTAFSASLLPHNPEARKKLRRQEDARQRWIAKRVKKCRQTVAYERGVVAQARSKWQIKSGSTWKLIDRG